MIEATKLLGWAGMLLAVMAAGERGVALQEQAKQHARATLQVGMWTLWHDKEVTLTPAGKASICVGRSGDCSPLVRAVVVRADETNRIRVSNGDQTDETNSLRVTGGITLSAHGESETLQNPVTIAARGGMLRIAVTLPVERYVEQVVASESGPSETIESLKALAIVVRSYALHEAHGHPDYDVCDSTHCQLLHWHGVAQRRAAAHRATLETAGETLWFHGSRALGYFNKDCGGHGAAMNEVWPKAAPVAYLSARADPYCAGDGQQWATELSRAELTTALAKRGVAAPGWQRLTVERRADSGRVTTVRMDGVVAPAEDFRIAVGETLGWNKIPSTWFEVSQNGDRFLFHGRGWGHGVGLCQRGAAAMGTKGRNATEILAQYFPGAQRADEATGRLWTTISGEGFTLETLDSSDAGFLTDVARARGEASQRSGLNANAAITVRAFPSTNAFRDETLAPGWVAAFAEGNWIATQPLSTLAARKLLSSTLRHEFLHALLEQEAGPAALLWLREGLVELWSASNESAVAIRHRTPVLTLENVEAGLRRSDTEAQSEAVHRDAAIYAARVLDRYGRDEVIRWLRSGVPAQVVSGIVQR
jgi:stage II sporulation protein D